MQFQLKSHKIRLATQAVTSLTHVTCIIMKETTSSSCNTIMLLSFLVRQFTASKIWKFCKYVTHSLSPKTCCYLHSKITTDNIIGQILQLEQQQHFGNLYQLLIQAPEFIGYPQWHAGELNLNALRMAVLEKSRSKSIYMTFGILSITLCRTSYTYITFGAIRLIHTKSVLVFIGISMFQAESC
jgi:hypothetical protein